MARCNYGALIFMHYINLFLSDYTIAAFLWLLMCYLVTSTSDLITKGWSRYGTTCTLFILQLQYIQHKMFYVLSTRPRERFSKKQRRTNQRVLMATRGLIIVEMKAYNELAISLYRYILRLSKNENNLCCKIKTKQDD